MRRGVSGLLAALIIGLVMVSLISSALTLYYRVQSSALDTASRIERTLMDATSMPIISLDGSSSLHAIIYSPKPLNISLFLVEYANGTIVKIPGGLYEGGSMVRLVESYNCEPIRVYMILSSGLVYAYNPLLDPKVRVVPAGWSGWYTCNLNSLDSNIGLFEPRLSSRMLIATGGSSDYTVYTVNARLSRSIRVDYSVEGCTITAYTSRRASEVEVGSINTQAGSIRVKVGCIHTPGYNINRVLEEDRIVEYRILNLPLTIYLSLEGSEDTVYSGRVRVSYTAEFDTQDFMRDMSGYNGVLPVTYTPVGSSRFQACRELTYIWTFDRLRFSGVGDSNFTDSRILVLVAWTYYRPVERASISLDIDLLVREAIVYSIIGAKLQIGVVNSFNAILLEGSLSALDTFTEAIIRAYRLIPQAPSVTATLTIDSKEYNKTINLGQPISIAHPLATLTVEAKPRVDPPIMNMYYAEARDEQCGFRSITYRGWTVINPQYSPWRGPAILKAKINGEDTIIILAYPGRIAISQARVDYRGYAQLIPGLEVEAKPEIGLILRELKIGDEKIVASITMTRLENRSLEELSQKHIVIIPYTRDHKIVEYIVAWVN